MLLSLKLRLDREAMLARPGTGDGSSLISVDCTLSIAQGQMPVSREINKDKALFRVYSTVR